jgi:hypothetical protein
MERFNLHQRDLGVSTEAIVSVLAVRTCFTLDASLKSRANALPSVLMSVFAFAPALLERNTSMRLSTMRVSRSLPPKSLSYPIPWVAISMTVLFLRPSLTDRERKETTVAVVDPAPMSYIK